jgi:hypothetical protein
MITGTDAAWVIQFARICKPCGHRYDEHINGRGPCTHHDGCTGFTSGPTDEPAEALS